ncbi:hypothetical protein CHU93_06995 [Sandarakinorhabdus cyanobacteriorum]|uniref:Oxidoreductase molybdopterin-binding domain-containing protein n=2 Tax=Sandarakinorhabdus cyanobacteriorum TaxID=1981098 RepID=A0A255YNQ6_9SPHN|nr:hypothetical protein CHU93_06995 [Sandarakinorhabdus cyanobacteriorum]
MLRIPHALLSPAGCGLPATGGSPMRRILLMLAALALMFATLPAALPLDAASLAPLPRATATLTAHGETRACEGVWLTDLAAASGLPAGQAVSGSALSILIRAEAADGYRVVFTLAELDRKLGNRPVLIADRCDGKPMAAGDGPLRLVVPGEARAARSVRQLVALRVEQLR